MKWTIGRKLEFSSFKTTIQVIAIKRCHAKMVQTLYIAIE